MATDPVRMANGTILVIPPNGANVIQAGQITPGTVPQPPATIHYGGSIFGNLSNQTQQDPQMSVFKKFNEVEAKTLGVIQIMIGLIHIGFGAVSVLLVFTSYFPLASVGGYPFWGGVFFIASGSVSVSAAKDPRTYLVKCSVGMNITSSVMASVGIFLYIAELAMNPHYTYDNSYETYLSKNVGNGLAALLFIFSVLEFCITVSTAHFGCQAVCCNYKQDTTMLFVPYTISANGVVPAEDNPPPPAYSTVPPLPKTTA